MNEPKEVCVDASLAVKWVVKESYDEEALTLLLKWRMDKVELIAPAFFEVEVDSIIRKKVASRKTLTESEGDVTDERLYNSVKNKLPLVKWLGEYKIDE